MAGISKKLNKAIKVLSFKHSNEILSIIFTSDVGEHLKQKSFEKKIYKNDNKKLDRISGRGRKNLIGEVVDLKPCKQFPYVSICECVCICLSEYGHYQRTNL